MLIFFGLLYNKIANKLLKNKNAMPYSFIAINVLYIFKQYN